MFGDILSDEASMITGSIGMIPSSSLGATSCGLYEPIHGSAPRHCGAGHCKPHRNDTFCGHDASLQLDLKNEADAVENAVSKLLDEGYRTADIMSDGMTKSAASNAAIL